MLFSTPQFILGYLPVVLLGYWASGRLVRRASLWWLLGASLFFYAWWKPLFVLLLGGAILSNFCIGRYMRRHAGRGLGWGLVFNLSVLGFFKYADFLVGLAGFAPIDGGIFLPLGISFFTFQQIMYLIDSRRGECTDAPLLEYACFVAFFPHLVSGPIVRPSHILPQLARVAPLRNWRENFSAGLEIFLLGLGKKLVLADSLAHFADPGFAAAARLNAITLLEAWVALLAYALQIYFDFSGYSDMAIGLARMFGIQFPINFRSPYKATDISDFWRRWNITLSSFLRDYLYIPLGGNRHGETRRMANLLVTMLLGGLWHGAGIRFLLWGGLHGIFLIVHGWSKQLGLRLPIFFSWALTVLCVVLAWVPFRAPNFAAALNMYKALFGLNGVAIPAPLVQAVPALRSFGHVVPVLPYLGDARSLSIVQAALLIGLCWILVLCIPHLHEMNKGWRGLAYVSGFALTLQAFFFAPYTIPFVYFQF